jgi:hypothetical protein
MASFFIFFYFLSIARKGVIRLEIVGLLEYQEIHARTIVSIANSLDIGKPNVGGFTQNSIPRTKQPRRNLGESRSRGKSSFLKLYPKEQWFSNDLLQQRMPSPTMRMIAWLCES